MAKGNPILVTSGPKGVFMRGTVSGALKPGTLVQIKTSAGIDANGRFTFEAYAPGTDGDQRIIMVLEEDRYQGKLATEAYVDGDECQVYVPVMGEELNMLLADVAGTADDHAFGELLIADTGTGKLIATTGSPESEPFQLLEAVTDPTADQLVHCLYTGH